MNKVGILGGGFGLYGYMPSFIDLNYEVITLKKYKPFLDSRKELSKYIDKLIFVNDETNLLKHSTSLVIARNPVGQEKIVNNLEKKYLHLYLEKPLASNNKNHGDLLTKLNKTNQQFSVFYLFSYLNWYVDLKKIINTDDTFDILINWDIAHNRNDNDTWKYKISEGGGLGRYYGIHFFDLVDNYSNFKISIENNFNLFKVLLKKNEKKIQLIIKFSEKNSFNVTNNKNTIFSNDNPYIKNESPHIDPRIKYLKKYITNTTTNMTVVEEKSLLWLKIIEQD